jgi:hypothetical protein
MPSRKLRPRCTIQIVNVRDKVVPILDAGAAITPEAGRTKYREYWTEEEDLSYVFRRQITGPSGAPSKLQLPADVHGNIGYELLLSEKTRKAVLRLDYFTVSPFVENGKLSLEYEPKSVTVSGILGQGSKLQIDVELQAGFSEAPGKPDFKYLRVTCK